MENADLKSIVKQRYARAALGVTPFVPRSRWRMR